MTQRCHAAPGCGPSPAPAARLAAIACAFVATIPVSTARAQGAPGSLPASRRGEVFDLRLSAGGAGAEYRQHSYAMAHLEAVSLSASLRWGGFIDPHFCFGYELLVGQHIDVGTPTIYPPYVGELRPAPHESYTVVSPIGAFIELYPIDQQGLYLGASASVGLLSLPEFAHEDGALMAGYGGELGYDTSGSGKQGLGFFLRYSRWSGLAIFSEHGDQLSAREISLGARWAFSMAR